MMKDFSEFLREEAARRAADTERHKGVVEDWQAAVTRLFDQIREWLGRSDPDQIIRIEQKSQQLQENGLGRYQIPRLDLDVFGKWIGIIPKARYTVASAQPPQKSLPERATGRVDITDEIRRYILLRFRDDAGVDQWMIDDLRSGEKPLDKQSFENALMGYIR